MNRKLKSIVTTIAYSPIGNRIASFFGAARLFALYKVYSQKKKFLRNAKIEFNNGSVLGNFEDYKNALDKHWVSYNEYAKQYEFYKKTEEERSEFVSRLKMAYFHRRYSSGATKAVFLNKNRFLVTYKKYIHRKWLYVPQASFEDFKQLVSNYDCIIKPCDGKLGKGIFKVYKNDTDKNIHNLYEMCLKNRMLAEQCIDSCDELKILHPQSLNTIRVVTVSNSMKSEVFGSFIRMGVGNSVVDNAHAGGVFAQINIKDGIIESDGIDTDGNKYVCHPNSNIKLKGFKIPKWKSVVETCCEAAKLSGNTIMGWDVAINNNGDIEFVEANYGPDFDVMQSPLQIGVKKRIFAKIKEYSNIDIK